MRWDGQGATVFSYENAMTTLLMPTVDVVLARHRLECTYLPVQWTSAHGNKELGRCVHMA
jgi:hypothetical protein